MIKHSFREAYRLIGRSKKETGVYLLSFLLCGAIYILMCRALGLGDAYLDEYKAIKNSPFKGIIAYLPGFIASVWFAAGITGRFVMDSLKGAPESMTHYANNWFSRNLAGEAILTGIIFVPGVISLSENKLASVPALAWFVFALWFALRMSLWLNASFTENLGLFKAMKRSYTVSVGNLWGLIVLIVVPFLVLAPVLLLIDKVLPGQPALRYLLGELLNGIASTVIIGALAAAYLALTSAKASAAAD